MVGGHRLSEADDPEPGSNRVLLASRPDAAELVSALDRVRTPADPDAPLLIASWSHSAQTLLDARRIEHPDAGPPFGMISIGELSRSAATGPSTMHVGDVTISTVGRTDLTGLVSELKTVLSRWDEQPPVWIWFDSITELLDAVELELAFRFLHVVTTMIEEAGAIASYRIDPAKHSDHTLLTFTPLFDETIEL